MKTLTFDVRIVASPRKNYLVQLHNGVLTIQYPDTLLPTSPPVQSRLQQGVEAALRHEAQRVLPVRIRQLGEAHGFAFAQAKITKSRSRWGSCSSRRSINLSYFLLLLPAHLVDYVLLHELCHTVEMNHSPRFWALLNRTTGGQARALAKEMKGHRTGIPKMEPQ